MLLKNLSHKSCTLRFWGTIWIMKNTAFFCLESTHEEGNVCHLRLYAVKSSTIQAQNKAFIVLALTQWNKPTLNIRLVRWVRAWLKAVLKTHLSRVLFELYFYNVMKYCNMVPLCLTLSLNVWTIIKVPVLTTFSCDALWLIWSYFS